MAKKSTTNLENELKKTDSLERFLERNHEELNTDSLPAQLQELII